MSAASNGGTTSSPHSTTSASRRRPRSLVRVTTSFCSARRRSSARSGSRLRRPDRRLPGVRRWTGHLPAAERHLPRADAVPRPRPALGRHGDATTWATPTSASRPTTSTSTTSGSRACAVPQRRARRDPLGPATRAAASATCAIPDGISVELMQQPPGGPGPDGLTWHPAVLRGLHVPEALPRGVPHRHQDLGFTAADVCSFTGYPHTPPETVLADPDAAADVVIARLERLEPSRLRRLHDPWRLVRGVRARTTRIPRCASRRWSTSALRHVRAPLRAPGITVLPGTDFEGVPAGAQPRAGRGAAQRRAAIAGEAGPAAGVRAALRLARRDARARARPHRAHADVGFALDYSHFVYQGIPQEEIDALLPRTHHFHVAPGRARRRPGAHARRDVSTSCGSARRCSAGLRRLLRARVPVGGRLARLLARRLHRRDGRDAGRAPGPRLTGDDDQMNVAADRKALMTGGASGFGREIARALKDGDAPWPIVDVNAELATGRRRSSARMRIGIRRRRARSAADVRAAVEQRPRRSAGSTRSSSPRGCSTWASSTQVTEERLGPHARRQPQGRVPDTQAAMPHLRGAAADAS